jgi:hypothetical protein
VTFKLGRLENIGTLEVPSLGVPVFSVNVICDLAYAADRNDGLLQVHTERIKHFELSIANTSCTQSVSLPFQQLFRLKVWLKNQKCGVMGRYS